MARLIDLTGQKFGKLTVIERSGSNHNGAIWFCKCDCGNVKYVPSCYLRNGEVKSCGCAKNFHGFSKERLYEEWRSIKKRCTDKNNDSYKYYGGRGIKVCDEWANDYVSFRNWSYANGYNPALASKWCSLDRTNNDGDYAPSNCRWTTATVQAHNKRKYGTACQSN